MNGVRRLMELYKKKTWDMATPDFQRLVRMDPENAKCNGYLNSAILYLRKFRESGGFDNLMDRLSLSVSFPRVWYQCRRLRDRDGL
eukprot:symbB.v1.2.018535.t1/scaffold1481.1/size116218/14